MLTYDCSAQHVLLPHKFTGKERDTESNLDNFEARYMASTVGRFMSPDPNNAGADATNPQSWNMYSYVGNNPLAFTDPTGLDPCNEDNGGPTCVPGTGNGYGYGTFPQDDDSPDPQQSGQNPPPPPPSQTFDLGCDHCILSQTDLHIDDFCKTSDSGCAQQLRRIMDGLNWYKTFAKTFGANLVSKKFYKEESQEGGCLHAFWEGFDDADVLGKIIPADSHVPEASIKSGAGAAAASYAANRGLTVPLRSSTVRGILETGETAAGAFGPAYVVGQEIWGLRKEGNAVRKGQCH